MMLCPPGGSSGIVHCTCFHCFNIFDSTCLSKISAVLVIIDQMNRSELGKPSIKKNIFVTNVRPFVTKICFFLAPTGAQGEGILCMRLQAGKQASKQAGRRARKQVSKEASKQVGKQAGKQAGKQGSKQAGKQASRQASQH